jgi:hypothetical protein
MDEKTALDNEPNEREFPHVAPRRTWVPVSLFCGVLSGLCAAVTLLLFELPMGTTRDGDPNPPPTLLEKLPGGGSLFLLVAFLVFFIVLAFEPRKRLGTGTTSKND